MPIQQHPTVPTGDGNGRSQWIEPAVWERRDMRQALAVRDIGAVYRLLQRFGVAQRRIAALVDQSQSEVSEIIAGRRVVRLELLPEGNRHSHPLGVLTFLRTLIEAHGYRHPPKRRSRCERIKLLASARDGAQRRAWTGCG